MAENTLNQNQSIPLGSETTTFAWVRPVVPLVQSDCRIL